MCRLWWCVILLCLCASWSWNRRNQLFHCNKGRQSCSSLHSWSLIFDSISAIDQISLVLSSSTANCESSPTAQSLSSVYSCISHFDLGRYATSGGFAGGCRALSRGLTYPFDTIKTLQQTNKDRDLVKVDYFRGLWIAVLSAIPANAVFFVIYYLLETVVRCAFHSPCSSASGQDTSTFMERILISSIATLPQNYMKVPSELIKQRAQVAPEVPLRDIATSIVKKDGWIGLFRGANAQLLRELPYNTLQMAFYEWLRALPGIVAVPGLSAEYRAAVTGLVAASLAALFTQPADVLKTRLMTAIDEEDAGRTESLSEWNKSEFKVKKSDLWRAVSDIYREQGLQGFYVGLLPRLGIVSIGGAIYFLAAAVVQDQLP